ncbi:SanA/YdcF family protein [Desulforamulus aeronauticus]|uniref:SanA protein n=1 Tax=Desulforamulus aeronauticus DSM 10349 TaxID=1121421 RepID=A0A1M6TK82_9FIRM|nr:ElyC/SanA/YdcF family protein [Desulforamulus aeronauticus]SHK57316.1 SanA protein [Desulforamulus aeronauticus DSM 10349]
MKRWFKRVTLLIAIFVVLLLGVNGYMKKTGQRHMIDLQDSYQAEAAIVLGAYVTPNGYLCDMLRDRVETAVELYNMGKVKKLLMSGDHGQESYDEVNHMRRYAEQLGVPSEDIFMDHAGFSTYESMYRSRDVFQVASAIIVTQEFHLPRAIYIARTMGLEAKGYKADKHLYSGIQYNEAREIVARNKDFINVHLLKPQPKFLGPVISINGDGRQTRD